jgi:hypothetical protein
MFIENSVKFSDGRVLFDTGVSVGCRDGLHADRAATTPSPVRETAA